VADTGPTCFNWPAVIFHARQLDQAFSGADQKAASRFIFALDREQHRCCISVARARNDNVAFEHRLFTHHGHWLVYLFLRLALR
jgi:hypothetical protein